MRMHPESPADSAASARALHAVKLAHTVVWGLLAACVVLIPVFAVTGRLAYALLCAALVALETLVLASNGWRCPLTDVAARYTGDRQENFDIYLPAWLARHNKTIFGTLYVVGLAVLGWSWWGQVE